MGFLLLHRGTFSRERISSTLWPDLTDSEARARLRRTSYELVQSLPTTDVPWLWADAARMAWNADAPLWCDVDVFERLCANDDTRASALEVYRGDLLGETDAEWVVEERARLRERLLETIEIVAAAYIASGDASRAARYYRRLLRLDPFREDVIRALLALRYSLGDRAGAIAEYRTFVRRLDAELGVAPMPETIACYENLLHDDRHVTHAGRFRQIDTFTFARIVTPAAFANAR